MNPLGEPNGQARVSRAAISLTAGKTGRMITLAACARFFDTDEGFAGRWPAQFLLGDPDGDDPVYSCLIEPADSEHLAPGGGPALVRLPMLTAWPPASEPAPLWRGAIVGELTDITVLNVDGRRPGLDA